MLDGGGQPEAQKYGEECEDEQGGDGEYPFDEGACILSKREHDKGDQAKEEKVDHAQAEGSPRREAKAGLSLGDAAGEQCADDEEVGSESDGQQEDDEGEAKDVGHNFSKGFVGARSPRPVLLGRRYWAEGAPLRMAISQQQSIPEDPKN